MNDKELLELAAKAAGLKCKWFKVKQWSLTGGCKICTGTINVFGTHHTKPWNPLTDDGDALRLAVKLGHFMLTYSDDDWEKCDHDGYAATRRAIVRAAAAIGEKL